MNKDTYMPIEGKIRCDFLHCYAGLGLAGRGFCFASGGWWLKDCPQFKDEDEWIAEREAAYEARNSMDN